MPIGFFPTGRSQELQAQVDLLRSQLAEERVAREVGSLEEARLKGWIQVGASLGCSEVLSSNCHKLPMGCLMVSAQTIHPVKSPDRGQ